MCRSTKSVRLMFIIAAGLVVFVARHPALVEGLEEKEEIVDDFDSGIVNYWQGYGNDNSSTIWCLSMHGDPAPFDLESIRPPMEENGGGFIEVVPFSDSPAQIFTHVFDLLPGATAELTYWNLIPLTVLGRHTVLILYTEFVDNIEDQVDAFQRSVQVFRAPTPTDPSPGWTTVTVDLQINQPSKVQLRLDGNRAELDGTGLAISKIVIKNGEDRSTTSTSTTTMMSTLHDISSSTKESQTETNSTSITTITSFPTPSKFDVEKTTTEISTTSTTLLPMPTILPSISPSTTTSTTSSTTSPSTTTSTSSSTPPSTTTSTTSSITSPLITSATSTTTLPSSTIYLPSSSSTSTLSSMAETTSLNNENTSTSSITSVVSTSSSSTKSPTTGTSYSESTTSGSESTTTVFTSLRSSTTTMPSSNTNSLSSTMSTMETTPSPTTAPSGLTSAQLRGIAIGVSLSIILLVLSCLLFGFLYRRHRRRVYLIEKSQLEAGTIRQLEQPDYIPSSPHKADLDSRSISSTTSSNAPLVPSEVSPPISPLSIATSTR
ncbi:uncharacterized protein LOC130687170 [Daphnia carinata]|uniref:uncharacterized protein LOC130687170 n=1 Tax=Daphnia carinata TaxID=120202 RepID=UPI00257E04D6|nr:uncharacterized protein LOC130687170 [Daphnia carinata]XP_057366295.1 uncharacterized protein LOC130687170 [Daphnia carinata]